MALIFIYTSIQSSFVLAQEKEEEHPFEFGLTTGPFMAMNVTGLDEILPFAGMRFSHFMSRPIELLFVGGRATGMTYMLGLASVKLDFEYLKMDDLTPFAMIGIQGSRYQRAPSTGSIKILPFANTFGGHIGWGLEKEIDSWLILRNDYYFGIGPGRILYAGLSFQIMPSRFAKPSK